MLLGLALLFFAHHLHSDNFSAKESHLLKRKYGMVLPRVLATIGRSCYFRMRAEGHG